MAETFTVLHNLTGHPVNWQGREIPPNPALRLRIKQNEQPLAPGLVMVANAWPSFLPPLRPRQAYVVSRKVRDALPWRPDLLSPDKHIVRGGQVVGARALMGNPGARWYAARPWRTIVIVRQAPHQALRLAQNDALLVLWLGEPPLQAEGIISVPPVYRTEIYLGQLLGEDNAPLPRLLSSPATAYVDAG